MTHKEQYISHFSKCNHVNCKTRFTAKRSKRFCSANCRKSQNKIDIAAKKNNPKAVVVKPDATKPSMITKCQLEGCTNPVEKNRAKFCCRSHMKKNSYQKHLSQRQEYDRVRDRAARKLGLQLGDIYYDMHNKDDRIRFLEGLLDTCYLKDNTTLREKTKRMLRSTMLRRPDLHNEKLFHLSNPDKYLTISEILENYCISCYGGPLIQVLKESRRPNPCIAPYHVPNIDERNPNDATAVIPLPAFDDEDDAAKVEPDEDQVEVCEEPVKSTIETLDEVAGSNVIKLHKYKFFDIDEANLKPRTKEVLDNIKKSHSSRNIDD